MPLSRITLAACATVLASAAFALEGAPPFDVVPSGRPVAELSAEVFVIPDMGFGGGYLHGDGPRSMRVKSYMMFPVGARYGLWKTLEAWVVAPLVWGSSPQEYVNARTGGNPETYRATLSGFDGSDTATGLRFEPWSSYDDVLALVVTSGLVIPLGTNVWQNSQYNFVTGPAVPDLASGDGSWKVLFAAELVRDTEGSRTSLLAGYLHRFAQEALAVEPPASTIEVSLPSPVVGWLRHAVKLSEETWLTARADGFWAPGGSIATGGLLTKTPEALPVILDSYENLVSGSRGIWAGAGIRQALAPSAAFEIGFCAPLMAHNLYRIWRLTGAVTWRWKP